MILSIWWIKLKILKQLSNEFKLLIIGNGNAKNDLKNYVSKQNLKHRVKILDAVEISELYYYTYNSDIGFCLIEPTNTNKLYSLPNKLFEYLYAGIPVLVINLPELSSIITKYKVGEIINPDNSDALIKIKKMQKTDYSKNIQKFQQEVNWKNEEKLFLKILNDMVNQ